MPFFVDRLEWEYGKQYGHVFYPENKEEFDDKLRELDEAGFQQAYPFYVEIFFADDSYAGIMVGHELSCFYFGISVSDGIDRENIQRRYTAHYDSRKQDDNASYIEYSFKGSHGEILPAAMLPQEQIFKAVDQYIETQRFPPYILFSGEEFVENYIQHD